MWCVQVIQNMLLSPTHTLQYITHHHPDGTVHSHEGGDELHSHPFPQETLRYGQRAPFGGEYAQYSRPGGIIVRVGTAPASAVCPLLQVQLEKSTMHALGMVANAYAKAGVRDEALFRRLAQCVARMDVRAFSALSVSNLLHATASLSIREHGLVTTLLRAAMRIPLREVTMQTLSNIAWAVAVLDVKDITFLRWLTRMLSNHVDQMNPLHLRQVMHSEYRPQSVTCCLRREIISNSREPTLEGRCIWLCCGIFIYI